MSDRREARENYPTLEQAKINAAKVLYSDGALIRRSIFFVTHNHGLVQKFFDDVVGMVAERIAKADESKIETLIDGFCANPVYRETCYKNEVLKLLNGKSTNQGEESLYTKKNDDRNGSIYEDETPASLAVNSVSDPEREFESTKLLAQLKSLINTEVENPSDRRDIEIFISSAIDGLSVKEIGEKLSMTDKSSANRRYQSLRDKYIFLKVLPKTLREFVQFLYGGASYTKRRKERKTELEEIRNNLPLIKGRIENELKLMDQDDEKVRELQEDLRMVNYFLNPRMVDIEVTSNKNKFKRIKARVEAKYGLRVQKRNDLWHPKSN